MVAESGTRHDRKQAKLLLSITGPYKINSVPACWAGSHKKNEAIRYQTHSYHKVNNGAHCKVGF